MKEPSWLQKKFRNFILQGVLNYLIRIPASSRNYFYSCLDDFIVKTSRARCAYIEKGSDKWKIRYYANENPEFNLEQEPKVAKIFYHDTILPNYEELEKSADHIDKTDEHTAYWFLT